MKCKNCDAENVDGAKFCSVCGKPLGGTLCPSCGAFNFCDALYCRECGMKLDGKRVCAKCGTELGEGDIFCPQCGEKCKEALGGSAPTQAKPHLGEGFRNGMRIAALAMSICLSAIAIIFTIFMGCNVGSVQVSAGSLQNIFQKGEQVRVNLLYYMKDAWETLDLLHDVMDAYNATVYIRLIFGLLLCVATLTLVLIFSIRSIIYNVKAIKGKNISGRGMSSLAFFTFVAGAVALFFLHSQFLSAKAMDEKIFAEVQPVLDSFTTSFNGATVAGFILGGVFLGLMIVFKILSKEKTWFHKQHILNASLSLGGAVLMTVFIAMLAMPQVSLVLNYEQYIRIAIGYGPYLLFGEGAMYTDHISFQLTDEGSKLTALSKAIESGPMIMGLSAAGFVLCCAALSLGAIYLSRAVRTVVSGEQDKKQFVFSLIVLIAAVANLVVTILANNLFSDVLVENFKVQNDLLSFSFAIPIVMVVISVLAFGVEIAKRATDHSLKQN